MSDFKERIQDDKYQHMLAGMIDDFFAKVKNKKFSDIIVDQQNCDFAEVLMQYSLLEFDQPTALVVSFVLGVYMATQGDAQLPRDLQ
ncbi:MAG: hypothetical protein WC773_04635 [Patescibacteria group bacterium]|jgi:hypothetical protein